MWDEVLAQRKREQTDTSTCLCSLVSCLNGGVEVGLMVLEHLFQRTTVQYFVSLGRRRLVQGLNVTWKTGR